MSIGSIYQYVLNHLSVLTDEELAEVDFDGGLAAINDEVSPDERQKLKELFSLIQKELPIYHHGVKGMKWGIRRYQNKDGTLTPAGKKRLADNTAKQSLFGTASKYEIKTRSGEVIAVEPVKPWSIGRKIVGSLLDSPEKHTMGRRGDANYTLTDSKGNSIGELSLISKNSKTAYIDWITVDESQRGKGYATDILNDLLRKAKDSGYSKVELNALKKARPLYERLGFTYTDTSKMSIMDRINGFEFGAKHMECDLNNLRHSQLYNRPIARDNMANELYHYGVKGMKWGVRRYQNKDGTLTPKGIKRYAREGYSQDFYKSNKTVLGKAYDKTTGAHKIAGKLKYDLSGEKENKARAEKYVAEKKTAVNKYNKKFKEADAAYDAAYEKDLIANERYKELGRNKISRIWNAARGKTDAAKRYNQARDEATSAYDLADDKWAEANEAYIKTGRNRVERIINNIKYDPDRKK